MGTGVRSKIDSWRANKAAGENNGMDSATSKSDSASSASVQIPNLDDNLIERANSAGTFVDYGDATARNYRKNAQEITEMSMSDQEKKAAIKTLHKMSEDLLSTEAKAISIYTAGPAVKVRGSEKAVENASQKRGSIAKFMDELRKQERKRQKAREDKALTEVMMNALNTGSLEFTFNGKVYRRKSKRSKSFYS